MQPRRATTKIHAPRRSASTRGEARRDAPSQGAAAAAHAIRRCRCARHSQGCGRRRRARKRDCPPLRGGMLGAGVLALLAGLACYLGAAMGIIECE